MSRNGRSRMEPPSAEAASPDDDDPGMAGGVYDRRAFIRVTGLAAGGLLVSAYLPACAGGDRTTPGDRGAAFTPVDAKPSSGHALTPFFRIEADGGVTIFAPKIEMGQGTYTSLPMILADELGADWSGVTVMPAPLDEQTYGWQGAGGSTSVWESYEPLRRVAATAREMLVAAAARRFGVEASSLRTESGRVVHEASGRSAHYGELASEAAQLEPPASPRLQDPSSFRIMGKPQRQVGIEDLVTGRVRYALDTRAPGMLRASIERAPVFGARPVVIDDTAARAVPGVRDVVILDADLHPSILAHGVAVIADSTWAAMKGRRALRIEWSGDGGRDASSAALAARFRTAIDRPGKVLRNDGDARAALAVAARTVEAEYELPFLAHAPMEPGNCFADVRPDGVTVRGPLQDPAEAIRIAVQLTGVAASNVRVEMPRLGGGFGRRLQSDYAAEAVQVSSKVGAPVQVVWSREDDVRHDLYRPAALHRVRASLAADGRIVAWHHRQVSTSRYGYQAPDRPPESSEFYPDDPPAGMVPNYRLEYSPVESPIPRGAWRSVVHSGNAFVVQSFVDELAHAAGRDPVEFRIAMLGTDRDLPYADHGGPFLSTSRLKNVLRIAADNAGWSSAPPSGRSRGAAVHFTFGGYAAQIAEVSVSDDGETRVHRIVASIDCGMPVNPAGIRAQVEGCIVFGLTAALYGEITIEGGGVVQSNFDDYPLLRIDRMPSIEVHIVDSREPPRGAGEISVPPVAPAIANAIFAATGVRMRRPPFTPARFRMVRESLAK
jgi:isoquinoline 1-oxidoreductase subunit beta